MKCLNHLASPACRNMQEAIGSKLVVDAMSLNEEEIVDSWVEFDLVCLKRKFQNLSCIILACKLLIDDSESNISVQAEIF